MYNILKEIEQENSVAYEDNYRDDSCSWIPEHCEDERSQHELLEEMLTFNIPTV